jgi:hypothetical protein
MTDARRQLFERVVASGEPVRIVLEGHARNQEMYAVGYEQGPSGAPRELMAECHRRCEEVWREALAELEEARRG